MNRVSNWLFPAAIAVACIHAAPSGATSSTAAAHNETRIDAVGYDAQTGLVVIDGERFADRAPTAGGIKPYVEFAGTPATVKSWSPTEIVLELASPLGEGEFQIYVERKTASNQVPHASTATNIRATYSLTVARDDGIAGPAGPQGPAGPAGPAGPVGAQGAAGAAGPQGPAGVVGPAGPQGERGAQGAAGVAGPQGAKGDTGERGATGAAGAQGVVGERGPQGPMGPFGPQGPRGDTGAVGATGSQGVAGPAGPAGPQGAQGPAGTPAPDGIFAGARRLECVAGVGTPCTSSYIFPGASFNGARVTAVCRSDGAPAGGNAQLYLTNFGPSFNVLSSGAEVQRTAVIVPQGGPNQALQGLTITGMARASQTLPNAALQTTTVCYFGFSAINYDAYD